MGVVGPALGRINRPAKANNHHRGRENPVPQVDGRNSSRGGAAQAWPHGHEFGKQYSKYAEDQDVVHDGKIKIQHDEFLMWLGAYYTATPQLPRLQSAYEAPSA
jgi:hypothetical protein